MIASFLFGVLIFDEKFSNIYCPIIGLTLLILGVIIVSLSDIDYGSSKKVEETEDYQSINQEEENGEKKKKLVTKTLKYMIGILLTIIMGILNATSMIPAKLDNGNLMYIFSFGISQFFIGNTAIQSYFVIKALLLKKVTFNRTDILKTAAAGGMCGLIWLVGYYSQVFSVFSAFGMSIGFILIQTTIVISTINGMFWFKELSSCRKKIQFFIGLFLILPGAFLLFYFRKK